MNKTIISTFFLILLSTIIIIGVSTVYGESNWIATDKEIYKVGDLITITGHTIEQSNTSKLDGTFLTLGTRPDTEINWPVFYAGYDDEVDPKGMKHFFYDGLNGIQLLTYSGKVLAEYTFTIDCSEAPDKCKSREDVEKSKVESKGVAGLVVFTDKQSYDSDDLEVTVTGLSPNIDPRNRVAISILEPNGDLAVSFAPFVDDNGEFTVNFPISFFELNGTHALHATDQFFPYPAIPVTLTFEYTNTRIIPPPSYEDTYAYNPLDEINKRLEKLENENAQLLITNSDLEIQNELLDEKFDDKNKELLIVTRDLMNQNELLNEKLDDLLLIIMEQIKVMMANFQ